MAKPAPEGWINGVWNHVGMTRPLHLIREGIIDAWISSYQPDLPEPDNPEKLVANKHHPLAKKKDICKQDLESFPALSLSKGWFPLTEKKLRSHGLWSREARMKRYRKELWEDKTEDQATLSYATCLGLEVMENLSVLDYDLDLTSGESLIVKRSLMNSEKVHSLLSCLKKRVIKKSKIYDELALCF